jgi:putative flippase GtrA
MTSVIRQTIRFGIVGIVNTVVGLLSIYGAIFFLDAGPVFANAFGYTVGLGISFLLNRIWTFNDTRTISKVLPRYIFAAAIAYFSNLLTVLSFTHYSNLGRYQVQLFGIVIYTTLMFIICRVYVFSKPSPDASNAKH